MEVIYFGGEKGISASGLLRLFMKICKHIFISLHYAEPLAATDKSVAQGFKSISAKFNTPTGGASNLAERKGFEPLVPCGTPLFESGQLNHSCISPSGYILTDMGPKGTIQIFTR